MDERQHKNLEYALLILVIALAGIAYYFGYLRYLGEAEQADKERQQIEAQIEEIAEKKRLQEFFKDEITESKEAIAEIASKYGTGNSAEKNIMFVKSIEDLTDSTIASLSFTDDEAVYISSRKGANGGPEIAAYKSSMVINYELSYEELKETLDYIHSYPERMNVESLTASYNSETRLLSGSMTINLYAVTGDDREYEAPDIPGIKIGTDNIFGTYR